MKTNILIICMDYKLGIAHYFDSICSCLESDLKFMVNKVILIDKLFETQASHKYQPENQNSLVSIHWGKTFLSKLFNILFPCFLDSKILKLVKQVKPDITFIIYDCYFLTNIKKINKISPTILVVHDLVLHPKKQAKMSTILLDTLMHSRAQKKRSCATALLTHSESQYKKLLKMFPSKKHFLTSMHSLITKEIIQGKNKPIELKNDKNYILFWGRIEEYKGLEYLVDAYIKNKYLMDNFKLVIAGYGVLPKFEYDECNFVIINRYLNDNEIRPLMENAAIAVFPYTSSTQSAPPIIAAYFGVPSIVTNVDGLKEHIDHGMNGLIVPPRDITSLQCAMLDILQNSNKSKVMRENQLVHFKKYHALEIKCKEYDLIFQKVIA